MNTLPVKKDNLLTKPETLGYCGALVSCECGRTSAQYIHEVMGSLYSKEHLAEALTLAGWKKIGDKWRCPTCVQSQRAITI